MNPAEEKWEKLERARKLFGLPARTTRKEVVERYHQLAKRYHPDHGGNAEKMKEINEAYQLLISFCDNYPIEIKPLDNTFDPVDFWFQHFSEDPVWGKVTDKEKERRG